jgi:hypothetical protein
MRCPYCQSTATTERPDQTKLGYRRFRCRKCQRGFNERTGTPFNRLQYPMDVVCLVVLWRFRYKLSLRDLVEMFLQEASCSRIKPCATGKRNWHRCPPQNSILPLWMSRLPAAIIGGNHSVYCRGMPSP